MRRWWKRRQRPAHGTGPQSDVWPQIGRLTDGDTVLGPGQRRAADILAEATQQLPHVPPLRWRRPGRGRS